MLLSAAVISTPAGVKMLAEAKATAAARKEQASAAAELDNALAAIDKRDVYQHRLPNL